MYECKQVLTSIKSGWRKQSVWEEKKPEVDDLLNKDK